MPSKFVTLQGGLDLATPPIKVDAGSLSSSLNFFESVKGGYTSVAGYERYDGQAAPSEALYYVIEITNWDQRDTPTPFVVGDTFTVDTATYKIVAFYESASGSEMSVVCDTPTGTPPSDLEENPLAYLTDSLIVSAEVGAALDETTRALYEVSVREKARTLIQPLTGVNTVRGVAQINDDVLGWRDAVGTENLVAYKATTTGWQAVNYSQIVAVVANTAPAVDDLCNNGDYVVTGVYEYLPTNAAKQMLTIGKVDSTASDLSVSDTLTRDSDSATIGDVLEVISYTFNGGGKIRAVGFNFYGGSTTKRLYFADGINCAAVYFPEYNCISPIATNYRLIDDVVTHVEAHNSRLFMATSGGTFITSVVGEPTTIDGLSGSQEIGLGDEITGFSINNTETLTIFTRNTTQVLQGTNPTDWKLTPISYNSGAIPDCVARVDDVFAVDDRGINQISRTDKLGGFDAATITDDVQSLFISLRPDATCATSFRKLNQMRFFFGNQFLFVSRVPFSVGGQQAIRYGTMLGAYPMTVVCVSSEENLAGHERVFVGADNGYIYQLDKGTSFDGDSINHFIGLHANHLKSPSLKKRFRYVDFEIASANAVSMTVSYELAKGKQVLEPRYITTEGAASVWDVALWNEALYDGLAGQFKRVSLVGSAPSINFAINHTSATDRPFTISGYTLTYTQRGLRGFTNG